MYKGKAWHVNDIDKIIREIEGYNSKAGSSLFSKSVKKVFLADADPFTAGYDVILKIMEALEMAFGRTRVSAYARPNDILDLDKDGCGIKRLARLAELGFKIAYIGLETGSPSLLGAINKGSGKDDFIKAVDLLNQAGIKSSVTAVSGLGGKKYSKEHIIGTADAVNACSPTYFNLLTLIPGKNEKFIESLDLMNSEELLLEQREMVRRIEARTVFRVDHSSNLINLNGRLPRDRDRIIGSIDNFIEECRNSCDRRVREWLRSIPQFSGEMSL
jgi:radical SAM superfamily enzyme YgiQ (UPF0313 family)